MMDSMEPFNSADLARIQRCETQLRDFLEEVLRGVPPHFLSQYVIPGKWSALENLAHLARYHEVFQERLDQILLTTSPIFSRYRAEEDPEWEAWRTLPPTDVLAKLSSLRGQLLAKLKALHGTDFSRTAIHPKFGEMTISLWLEFFLVHEAHHLYLLLQHVRSFAQGRTPPSR
jgi:hypothetical protein